MNDQSMRG